MADGVRVNVQGATTLGRTLGTASRQLADQRQPNTEAGRWLARNATGRAPRRTGRLAGSLTPTQVDRTGVSVSSSVRYASFQEYGTRRNRAHYFLTGALADLTTDIYADYADQCLAVVKGT